jgi:hypothetical protein
MIFFVELDIYDPGPDFFTSGLFLGLKSGLPVGLAGADGPVRPQAQNKAKLCKKWIITLVFEKNANFSAKIFKKS